MANRVMTARIIRIGNSEGIRIPKIVREQLGLVGEIEMEVVEDSLLIRAKKHPRDGWEEEIAAIAANDHDEPVWPDYMQHDFDDTEWEWPVEQPTSASMSI